MNNLKHTVKLHGSSELRMSFRKNL